MSSSVGGLVLLTSDTNKTLPVRHKAAIVLAIAVLTLYTILWFVRNAIRYKRASKNILKLDGLLGTYSAFDLETDQGQLEIALRFVAFPTIIVVLAIIAAVMVLLTSSPK